MKILLFDNYDSFTYNLLHILKEFGADTEVFRNDRITLDEVARFDKIILSPGPGIPQEAGILLPLRAVSALSVALYGMFLAIIIPPARKDKVVAVLVALSFALSFACNYLPGISALSDGTRTILLTVLISSVAAVLFPVKQEADHE